MSEHISPDGNVKIIIDDYNVQWFKLTEQPGQFTIEEIVEATKKIKPELWNE